MNALRRQLLLVDDNDVDRQRVIRLLGTEYEWIEANTVGGALDAAANDDIDGVLLDFRMPDADGLDALDELVARGLPVVMLTGQGDERTAVEAMKRGAQDYLVKTRLTAPALRRSIALAIEKVALHRRLRMQQEELERRLAQVVQGRAELARKNAALVERETQLRMIVAQLPAIVWTTDRDLRCVSVSGSADSEILDGSAIEGRNIVHVLDAENDSAMVGAHKAALRGETGAFELQARNRTLRGRAEAMRDSSGGVTGVIGVAVDVTESLELEHQVRHAHKMDALGQLAGGVAHDFNNLLAAITSFTELAKDRLPSESPVSADLDEVLGAARRGADLVRQLLTFSRKRAPEPRPVAVNGLVKGLVPMLERLVGESVQLSTDLGAEPVVALADPGGVEQIIVNLVVNGRDAMHDGGGLSISTRRASLDVPVPMAGKRRLDPGEYVVVSVTDEGAGVPAEIRDRIFDPFFSTKDVDEGSGLGLSTCYGVVRKAGGGIALVSAAGRGSTFRVYLPATDMPVDDVAASTLQPPVAPGACDVVLVIEDDPQVLRAVIRTLRGGGYRVHPASNATEATALAQAHAADITLVLSDVMMPDVTGPELTRQLAPTLPEAAVLYMSGYTDVALRQREHLRLDAPVLEKPFTAQELLSAVATAVDARG